MTIAFWLELRIRERTTFFIKKINSETNNPGTTLLEINNWKNYMVFKVNNNS